MRKIVIILSVVFSSVKLAAQEVELPQYVSHLADNPFLISPTYAGIGTGLQVRLNGVSQWIGVKDAPDTQSLTVEARIADTFGGGITLFNDKNGYTTQKGAKLSFASHLTLSDFHDSFLSFALSYSFTQFGIDTSENNSGQTVSNRTLNNSNFDVGLLYRYERFSISANIMNILNKEIEDFQTGEPEVLRKYVLFTSYTFTKLSRNFELEPSMLVEYREADKRSRTDMNIKARRGIRDGYVWAGLSYTFLNDQFFQPNAIAPLLGLKKNNLYMSYGFSINMNKTQDYNYGTHMITLGFDYERRPSLARCTQKMIMF
ncbi:MULTISPECIES: PorP/SprF family type IX secretion system membrane protein [Tenacibaculum]|uniref:Type IX secretion system membrane protein PorP/SprF n=1 Tax=Tenacibaculum mesophilum TaxID=104268 RepID=A0AAE9MJZ1_9FLAO|nr:MULTISPECIES: type IX secretion system membrane protein PorP/SprF [Tenacibaculum]GFD74505.1 membrane protein [Tenacibaculum sp. KUL113]GFD92777.1 membrane protein [Alteromonas sp. KUL154]AZJ31953.1 type IX secretion system membrane protein PorP/SprF [Tenacibaculum mesophilum]KAF9658060.1 type IX secretion system membrane protein PorP/SprF [Tenacibaculum mesophilum]MCO7185325.1 type IX secretion system membrane protein PorP/SprF [Tenacibaculum sp. XPcli2-G]